MSLATPSYARWGGVGWGAGGIGRRGADWLVAPPRGLPVPFKLRGFYSHAALLCSLTFYFPYSNPLATRVRSHHHTFPPFKSLPSAAPALTLLPCSPLLSYPCRTPPPPKSWRLAVTWSAAA